MTARGTEWERGWNKGRPRRWVGAVFLLTALAFLPAAPAGAQIDSCNAAPAGPFDMVITVDWALDETPDSSGATCSYCANGSMPCTSGLFFPAADGRCTLRRAIRQAAAMASSSDVTIKDLAYLINFTGLNGTDGNADDTQYDAGADQWTLPIDAGSSAADHFRLKPQGLSDIEAKITICGLTLASGLPRVFVDTASSLEIEMEKVALRRLGFFGGGGVVFKESDALFRQNMWGLTRDGQEIAFVDPVADANDLAGPIGVNILLNTDNIVVKQSRIAGAATKAIQVASQTTGVEIYENYIGTRSDGTVPVVPAGIQCESFANPFGDCDGNCPNAMDWYGGWGISAAGTGAQIHDNVIAGMQNIRSTNDTPPIALEIFGADHVVQFNDIGLGVGDAPIGTCGQGFKYSGTGHLFADNVLKGVRQGFENTKGAILWSDSTAVGPVVWNTTMLRNLVIDCEAPDACTGGTEELFDLVAGIDDDTKNFRPGKITSWVGTAIEGQNGFNEIFMVETPCPLCRIDFFSDDMDGNEEALEHLGFTTADAGGDFTHTLAAPLAAGLGIRTMSTANGDEVIPRTLAGFTSVASVLYVEGPACPASLVVDGVVVSGVETYSAAGQVTLTNFTAQGVSTVSVIAGTVIEIGVDSSIGGTFTGSLEPNCGL